MYSSGKPPWTPCSGSDEAAPGSASLASGPRCFMGKLRESLVGQRAEGADARWKLGAPRSPGLGPGPARKTFAAGPQAPGPRGPSAQRVRVGPSRVPRGCGQGPGQGRAPRRGHAGRVPAARRCSQSFLGSRSCSTGWLGCTAQCPASPRLGLAGPALVCPPSSTSCSQDNARLAVGPPLPPSVP